MQVEFKETLEEIKMEYDRRVQRIEAAEGKKEWVGLTDEEILDIVGRAGAGYPAVVPPYTRGLFKKIEDKLKEKNKWRCSWSRISRRKRVR